MTLRSESVRKPIHADADAATGSNVDWTVGPVPVRTSSPVRPTGLSHVASLLSSLWQGAWSREVWTNGALVRLFVVFLLLGVCSWLGIVLSRQSEGVATIWLSNGILFGLVITRPRQQWLAYFAAGVTADTLADMVYGDPFHLAVGVSIANSVEVITSCLFLTLLFGTPLNLSKRYPLVGFLLVSVVGATALTSALGASWTLLFVDAGSWWKMFRTWYLGDILGMAIFAPLVFMLQRPGFFSILRRRHLPHTLLVLLVPAVTTVLVFTHDQDPLIFFIFPALLLVVFRLGFSGTVLTIFMLALLSIGFTIKNHGPLMLITGDHVLLHRIVIAQIFLSVAIFTMFPVAALLEEREALQLSLTASEARHRRLAHADELTGLYNRRAFNQRLEMDWKHAVATGESIAMLLLDADLFKNYNDLHGHLRGDECLRSIASIIAESIEGEPRTAARFGGEEFAIILPGETADHAQQVAEQVRRAILAMQLPNPCTSTGVQTVSLGVAALVPKRGQHVIELISLADRALYRAKDLGRNRVVVA
jgi:diguanylate cyclase (GGDEF)-like protein